MNTKQNDIPDHTAVRVALWRALHVLLDSPHVLKDKIVNQKKGFIKSPF